MKLVGKHIDRELYYFDLESELEYLKNFNNWILLFICNSFLDEKYISNVFKTCIKYGVLEFGAQGKRGDWLALQFDLASVDLEIEKHTYFDISSGSGDNSTNLESAIWECFYASVLPSHADWENIKIFCTTSDKVDYLKKIQNIFNKIKSGCIPE
jgi:hypothetical protein